MGDGSQDGSPATGLSPRERAHADLVLIDCDSALRQAIAAVFEQRGLSVRAYGSTADFRRELGQYSASCVLLEARLPDETGLDLLRSIGIENMPAPVIMTSTDHDIATVVSAIRLGALDFLEKPINPDLLPPRICGTLAAGATVSEERRATAKAQFDALTDRQRQILTHVLRGLSNKEIARQLEISPRTVEIHRARIRSRLGLSRVAEMTRMMPRGG